MMFKGDLKQEKNYFLPKSIFKFKDHQWEAVTVPEEKVQIYSIEGIKLFSYNCLLDSYYMEYKLHTVWKTT